VLARAAGLPDAIHNRDSRPGAATEADVAGAPQERIQRGLGHSKGETTRIYLREDIEINRALARLRVEKRKP
jgi:integrase